LNVVTELMAVNMPSLIPLIAIYILSAINIIKNRNLLRTNVFYVKISMAGFRKVFMVKIILKSYVQWTVDFILS